jgi:hypothetical protein
MALSNKYSVDEGGKFICFKCKGDMSVEKAFEFNQQNSQRKEIPEELENLQRDMVELNHVPSSIKRCSVKEDVLAEVNLIAAKIDSLKDLTVVNSANTMSWSEAAAKSKTKAHTLQNKPCQIPITNNRYDLLSFNERHVSETISSRAVQQTTGRGDHNKKVLNVK